MDKKISNLKYKSDLQKIYKLGFDITISSLKYCKIKIVSLTLS